MGYDCTLHLIDEKSLGRFIKRFLKRSKAKSAFDRSFKNGDELFSRVRERISTSPGEAGQALMQLCLMWCSADAPHLMSRNFALSLWDEAQTGFDLPFDLVEQSLGGLLKPIVDEHPGLRLYLGFEGNYSVGYYVTPANVPKLREFVLKAFDHVSPDFHDPVADLLRVLEVAQNKGLAYWEATDLDVANGKPSWLKQKARAPSLERTPLGTFGGSSRDWVAARDDLLVVSFSRPDVTWIVDTAATPVAIERLPGFFTSQGFIRDDVLWCVGRCDEDDSYEPFSLPLRPLGEPHKQLIGHAEYVVSIDNEVLVTYNRREPSCWLRRGKAEPAGFPERIKTKWDQAVETVPFGDGSTFVAVDLRCYRYVAGRIEALPLERFRPGRGEQQSYAESPGVVVTLDDRRLVRITAAGERTGLAPTITNIMQLVRIPGRALVLLQGENLEKDFLKILWSNGAVTRLKHKDFGLDAKLHVGTQIAWSESLDALVIYDGWNLFSVPFKSIAAFKRLTAEAWQDAHEQVLEKERKRTHRLWEKKVRKYPPIQLPVSEDGYDDPVFIGRTSYSFTKHDVVEHPVFGLGFVLRSDGLSGPLHVQFEDGQREIVPTEVERG